MKKTCKELDDVLMFILDGKGAEDSRCKPQLNNKENQSSSLPSSFLSLKPMTVMGFNNKPVIVKDPVRFRNQIQDMVMSTMISPMMSDDQMKLLLGTGNMIQIATTVQMRKAVEGNLDSFKYIMDRVLGKPVNQTNAVSVNITYEQFCANLDPNEKIESDDIITAEFVEDL